MAIESWMRGQPRRLLLATDLSARCDRAFDRAIFLVAAWKAELVVVHVQEDFDHLLPTPVDVPPSWRRAPDMRQLAESWIRAEISEISPDLSIVIEAGDPAEAILRTAHTHDCDLIVAGVARNEILGRIALGNTVSHLARYSEVPVLVVRKRGTRPYGDVVVATDFSPSSRHALDAAARFFPNGRLTLFNAFDAPHSLMAPDPTSHRAQFREAAERDGRTFLREAQLPALASGPVALVVEYGDPSPRLYEHVTAKGVDLVALGTHGRSALFHTLIGSVAQSLIESLPCDVLVVPEPKASRSA